MAQEKTFENKIKKHLDQGGCYFVKYFANRMTKVGVPDILACVNGYFIGIEVKSETGRPSDLQIYNAKKITESGGIGVIVRPSDFELLKELILALDENQVGKALNLADQINDKFF